MAHLEAAFHTPNLLVDASCPPMSLELRVTAQQYVFRTLATPFPQTIPKSSVRLLGRNETKQLLHDCISQPSEQKAASWRLLENCRGLHPSLRSFFIQKDYDVSQLRLRLICDVNGENNVETNGFIAMSYRWRGRIGGYPPRRNDTEDYLLPTSDMMYQAILDERRSLTEGLWLDQVCVNQHDEVEKTATIGVMDTIYQSARLVIIALDDVELSQEEISVLKALGTEDRLSVSGFDGIGLCAKMYSNAQRTVETLRNLLERIAGSEYFERAWCQHEWRMGRKHIFLARCKPRAEDPPQVLRFTGAFLQFMIGEYVKDGSPSLNATKLHRDLLSVYSNRHIEERHTGWVSSFKSYIPTLAEVFLNKAGGDPLLPTKELREYDANKDKVSIVLNAINCGLQLSKISAGGHDGNGELYTLDEIRRQLLLLALAAGDPVALCTTGNNIYMGGQRHSWLCWPYTRRIDERFFGELPRIYWRTARIDPSPACAYVDIDLTILETDSLSGEDYRIASAESMQHARHFLRLCLENGVQNHRSAYWEDLRQRFGYDLQRDDSIVASTLALLVSQKSDHPDQLAMLQDEGMVGNMENLAPWDGYGLDQHGSALQLLEKLKELIPDRYLVSPLRAIPAVLTFRPQGSNQSKRDTSKIARHTSYLVFLPDVEAVRSRDRDVKLAVPNALLSEKYSFLARCWVLRHIGLEDGIEQWELLGKTAVASGHSDLMDIACQSHIAPRKQDRVYGPKLDSSKTFEFVDDSSIDIP